MKKLLKILSILTLLTIIIINMFLYGVYVAVDRINLNYENISSKKIPMAMNNLKIAFISDIKYGTFMDQKRLQSMITKFNRAKSDVIIFGGDLFDFSKQQTLNNQNAAEIIDIFKEMDAPYGKFAVLGDQDLINPEIKQFVESILYQSDFEIITNKSIRLRKENSESINLIGLDSMINGQVDSANAFKSINKEEFSILTTHCPDLLKKTGIPHAALDLALSGHSLGGQVYIPFIGPIYNMEGAQSFTHGVYDVNSIRLYVSNGIGTINSDIRLFSPPEVLIFRLIAKR